MIIGVETLFTSALGLRTPWAVEDVKLDTAGRRIDFEITCQGARMACPECGADHQPLHDRLRRSWRHLDFFQFEAWLHCEVPRVSCASCGKTSQAHVQKWFRLFGQSFLGINKVTALQFQAAIAAPVLMK